MTGSTWGFLTQKMTKKVNFSQIASIREGILTPIFFCVFNQKIQLFDKLRIKTSKKRYKKRN